MISELLNFISATLTGYSIYQNSRKGEKEKLNFVQSWGIMLEELKFCKATHDAFQQFSYGFDRFYDDYANSRDYTRIYEGWQPINDLFAKPILSLEYSFNLQEKLEQAQNESRNETQDQDIPLPIKEPIRKMNIKYPILIERLNDFLSAYRKQAQELDNKSFTYFSQNNDDLKKLSQTILGEADDMIVNLVALLTYYYDAFTR